MSNAINEYLDADGHYSVEPLLAYDKTIRMTYGGRRIGKTWDIECKMIDKFFDTDGEHKFLFTRRHGTQLLDMTTYFSKFNPKKPERYWKDWTVKKNKDFFSFYCKGKQAGWAVELGKLTTKGADFPGLKNMFFDEFIASELPNDRYLKDEFRQLINAIISIGNFEDDFHLFMAANNVTMYNPYFLELGYNYEGKRFWTSNEGLAREVVIERCPEFDVTTKYKNSKLGRALEGTTLGEHVFGNESLTETKNNIRKANKYCDCVAIYQIDKRVYGYWIDPRDDMTGFISTRLPNYYVPRYSIDEVDKEPGFFNFNALRMSPIWGSMVRQFNFGQLYFSDNNAKGAAFKMLKRGFY